MVYAIAQSDDMHAWLLRGFIEVGFRDVTLGGEIPESGGVSASNFRSNGGVDGVELVFPGYDPGEEWLYSVTVAGGRGGAVHVRCRDTMFSQSYAGLPVEQLAGRIGADVYAHNEAFVKWRSDGGQPSLAEQRAVTPMRGIAASPRLIELLERRYRMGQTLESGPAEGWWITAHSRAALGGQIAVGLGEDPTYRTRGAAPVAESPEFRLYASSVRTLGTIGLALGVLSGLSAGLSLGWAGFNVFHQRADVVLLRALETSAWPLASFLSSSLFAIAWIVGGLRMRALRHLTLSRVCVAVGMLPCLGPCGLVGLGFGAWCFWKLRDPKARAVFAS